MHVAIETARRVAFLEWELGHATLEYAHGHSNAHVTVSWDCLKSMISSDIQIIFFMYFPLHLEKDTNIWILLKIVFSKVKTYFIVFVYIGRSVHVH
ncbi:hypothetical protein ACJX0J_018315 [Zea mays]